MKKNKKIVQPVSGTKVPRFAGPSTFARLPELRDVETCDVAIVGIPFDAGTSYRPGARFGPQSIRQASRHLRTNYHPNYDTEPFVEQQVADAGDITCNPFNIDEAIKQNNLVVITFENFFFLLPLPPEKINCASGNCLASLMKLRLRSAAPDKTTWSRALVKKAFSGPARTIIPSTFSRGGFGG